MTLRDYVLVLRRRKWIVLLAAVVTTTAAVLVSLRQEHRYQAEAEILLNTQSAAELLGGGQVSNVQAERTVQTEANLARVPAIAAQALASVGERRTSVRAFLDDSSVSAKTNADILVFEVTSSWEELASRLANAYAREFIEYRRELGEEAYRSAREVADRALDQLEAADPRRASRPGSSPSLNRLTRSALYLSFVERQQQLEAVAALLDSRLVLVHPAARADLVSPRPLRNGLLGLALGILLGIGFAFLREALDTRVRSGSEIASHLDLPLLARLRGGHADDKPLVTFTEPAGVEAEAFRILRTNLELVQLEHGARTIMVTSALEGEGTSATAANLAVALARTGREVALVDLDLRHPSVAGIFGLGRRAGITDAVLGHVRLGTALVRVPVPVNSARGNGAAPGHDGAARNLAVLTAGSLRPNPGEFVGAPALLGALDELRRSFELVLVDAPPLLGVGDAIALMPHLEGVLLVASAKHARRSVLAEVRRLLAACPARKLGLVVTGVESRDAWGDADGALADTLDGVDPAVRVRPDRPRVPGGVS
jgi:Mrp family chromosome partitioning ATPase/capsular polysaccharide biosynthesis protein